MLSARVGDICTGLSMCQTGQDRDRRLPCNNHRLIAELVTWQEVIYCEDGSTTDVSARGSALPRANNNVPDRGTRTNGRLGEYLFDVGAQI